MLSQEYCCLAGRISAAHDDHELTVAHLCFHWRRVVIDAHAFELLAPLDVQATVRSAGCNQETLGGDTLVVIEMENGVAILEFQFQHFARCRDLCAEFLRLQHHLTGQPAAGQAHGEAGIVLNIRARSSLPAGRVPFQHQSTQPF